MSLVYPSNPLNAQDAKLIADAAIIAAKKVATDAWLVSASLSITAAAQAGNYSLSIVFDPAAVNLDEIVNKLSTVLGYTTVVNTGSSTIAVDWQSVARSKNTPDSNPGSNFGYEQPNSN